MKIAKSCTYQGVAYTHLSDDTRELDSATLFVRTKRNAHFAPNHPTIPAHELATIFAPLPKIIGITGTNGKTTTAAIIYSLLLDLSHSCALIGTRGVFANDKRLKPKGLTTPGVLELYEIFDLVRECEFVVMEVSSHAIEQERIAGVEFIAKILTNITSDHLDYHKTQEEYIRVKNSFFLDSSLNSVAGDSKGKLGLDSAGSSVKIINADEKRAIYGRQNACTYAIESNANCKVDAYSLDSGITAHVSVKLPKVLLDSGNLADPAPESSAESINALNAKHPNAQATERAVIHAKLYGKHNLYNILAAITCVRIVSGASPESIAKALEGFGGVEGRMEVVSEKPLVLVDFAHTHDGMEAIFESLIGGGVRDIAVVFGAGGDRDRSKRPKMGACAYKYAKKLYITSDNPRSEDPQAIIDEILQGIPKGSSNRALESKPIYINPNRRESIRQAVQNLAEHEALLILGKGDETYQIIGNRIEHFDDREEARIALAQRKS